MDHHQPVIDELRRTHPVSEVLPGIFYVARHEDIVEVCRHPDLFTQSKFVPIAEDTRTPDQIQLGESDPPIHTRVRKVLASVLSPPKVRAMEPFVRDVCVQLVERFAQWGSADLIADLGAPLPCLVIGHLAAIPEELRPQLRQYSDDVVLGNSAPDPEAARDAAGRISAFDTRMREVIGRRRAAADRPDDLLTGLIEATDENGRPLSDEKILTHVTKDVVVGGIETTTHLIGNSFFQLLSSPGLYERVRNDRSLVAVVVEESLRHMPIVQVLFRVAARDVEIRGEPIPAGSVVALGYASANRDEAVFAEPDVYDVDRGDEVRRHLGFGWGIHLCVGAPLARLEATSALNAVLDRVPSMELAPGFKYERVRFFMMRGPTRMDVVLEN